MIYFYVLLFIVGYLAVGVWLFKLGRRSFTSHFGEPEAPDAIIVLVGWPMVSFIVGLVFVLHRPAALAGSWILKITRPSDS